MNASLLALSSIVPPHAFPQEEIADRFIDFFSIDPEKSSALKKMYENSAIKKRHSVIGDFNLSREKWDFWGPDYPKTIPGMSKRNDTYKIEAPKLAIRVARKAIEEWGGALSEITHIISVSCTGVIAPGIEYLLMQELGLPATANRLGINFMGCFGAFKGLAVARAFALENPNHRVLLVCTELCTLHLQADLDQETLVGNSIFSDGAAAAIIGTHPREGEVALWDIIRTHSLGIENSLDKMSWEASDRGFLMRLSAKVPVLIKRRIEAFADDLLKGAVPPGECDWAIHPGGKSILQAVERALDLKPDQTQASWETFGNYGNMSSATFLFVLDLLARQPHRRRWSAGIAFGPGLSFEGILLQLPGHDV